MDFRNFRSPCFQRLTRIIEQAAIFNKQRQVVLAINAFHPADAIATLGKFIRTAWGKGDPCPFLDFGLEDIDTDSIQGIFGLGVLTVRTVTPITLGGYYRCRDIQSIFQRYKAKVIGLARIGRLVAVGHRQATANQYIEAHQLAFLGNRYEVQVIGMDINIILRRDHHGCLELPR